MKDKDWQLLKIEGVPTLIVCNLDEYATLEEKAEGKDTCVAIKIEESEYEALLKL